MIVKTTCQMLIAACLVLWGCDTKTKNVDACGDGYLDPGEQCDQDELSVTNCQQLGYYEQVSPLGCREDCTFDLTSCNGRCGDQVMQLMFGEQCDGENLVLTTNFCRARGYYGGGGGCSAACMLDEALCLDNGRCGDGSWQEAHESCEGTELGGSSCETLGYPGGTLACGDTCRFDVAGCVGGQFCGNGTLDGPEQCDGDNLNGRSCGDIEGFAGGDLSCGPDCRFDTNRCHPETVCGDQVVYGTEQCDGDNLLGVTCAVLGLGSGVLTCGPDCRFNADGCSVQGFCGDQVVYGTEECDGANLNSQTCVTRGHGQASGALSCTAGCEFNESACVAKSTNADLSTLTVSAGTLTPAFDANTTSYTVTVLSSVTTLTVAATTANPYASLILAPTQPMTLSLGPNPATVTVTAEDGTQKPYAVTITHTATLDYESPNVGTLIYVPGGTFQRDETATNLSTVSSFRMSRHEITRAQWTAVTGWVDPSHSVYSSGTSNPVQAVNWYAAIAFCNKLSLAEGLTPVYAVSGVDFEALTYAQIPTVDNATWNAATPNWGTNGYRLPTEMEWMWAAMGADTGAPGVTNTTGYTKAFAGSTGSNLIGDYAVFGYDGGQAGATTQQRSNPAGSKLANELGFHDLSGNVWEWVWDWYAASYPTGTLTDTRGPVSGIHRVRRGGGWDSNSSTCTVVIRTSNYPSTQGYSIGFRVVRP